MMAPADPVRLFLLAGRDKRLAGGCPWVYSNEIRMDAEAKALAPGTIAELHRVDGKPLAVGTFNPRTLIAFRRFAGAGVVVDRAFIRSRIEAARALRDRLFPEPFYRLVHAEADGLPGLVADRFGDVLVLQTGTAGMEAMLEDVLAALDETVAPKVVLLKNDGAVRGLEGLDTYVRTAKGEVTGPVTVRERDLKFLADPIGGQKTGWFFDQRRNREVVANLCRGGARMLDLYCHTGGFAIAAAVAGATEVQAVDRSGAALDLATTSAALNEHGGKLSFETGDAFAVLERLAAEMSAFDVVVADPPAFVKSKKDLASGAKGYRKLARLAAAVTAPGGFLFVASCSHNMPADLFAAEVAKGISAAGRGGRILRASGADADHPVHPHLPETQYLKTLLLQID